MIIGASSGTNYEGLASLLVACGTFVTAVGSVVMSYLNRQKLQAQSDKLADVHADVSAIRGKTPTPKKKGPKK